MFNGRVSQQVSVLVNADQHNILYLIEQIRY